MQTLWLDALLVVLGFVLLARGAGGLVDGGATLARRSGVSPLAVGLTIVAWGTSLPEVVVSSLAASEGRPGSSLGNVLGSNVANIALVLGASAFVLPRVLQGHERPREILWLLGSLGVLWVVCSDAAIDRAEALTLLGAFAIYNVLLWIAARREARAFRAEVVEEVQSHATRRPWTFVILGSVAVAAGAKLVVMGAAEIASAVGMPDRVVGLTIFAFGTSLPELAAGLTSAWKGHHEIGYGNVIGSNVFNALAVTGIAALVAPFTGGAAQAEIGASLSRDFPPCAVFTGVLVVLPLLFRGRAGRWPGGLLVTAYLSWIGWLLVDLLP